MLPGEAVRLAVGSVHGHVETHESSGGSQDNGRDEEGRWIGRTDARQLQ